jgi:hypothetical protein
MPRETKAQRDARLQREAQAEAEVEMRDQPARAISPFKAKEVAAKAGEFAARRGLPCQQETWAAYQEILLGLSEANMDDVVRKFNGDGTWADCSFVAELVVSVAGSRKNIPELIEFVSNISKTRGYDALAEAIGTIEALSRDSSGEQEIIDAMSRGSRKVMPAIENDAARGSAVDLRTAVLAATVAEVEQTRSLGRCGKRSPGFARWRTPSWTHCARGERPLGRGWTQDSRASSRWET